MAGYVCLPGAQSTSVSFKVALEFAFGSEKTEGHIPTLFVIVCQNYSYFTGFRMDSAFYSAHPYEQEVLLMEGTQVAVVGTDDFVIDNRLSSSDPFWAPYNNRVIHVVYLFQATGRLD